MGQWIARFIEALVATLSMMVVTTTAPPEVTLIHPPPTAPVTTAPPPVAGSLTVTSTAYCLTGTMANGERVHDGAVAMNGVPFGSVYRVVETGRQYVVKDRIGHGSQFDIWMASCAEALRYGRRMIQIEKVG